MPRPADNPTPSDARITLPPDSVTALERAHAGLIPADIDACTTIMRACDLVESVAVNVRWMTIARAHSLFDTPAKWLDWVMAEYPAYTNEKSIYSIRKIGDLLLCHARSHARMTLFSLGYNILLPMAKLPRDHVAPFCAKKHCMNKGGPKHITEMNRDEARYAVNRWLRIKEPPSGRGKQLAKRTQMDFLDALFAASEADAKAFHHSVVERAGQLSGPPVQLTLNRSLVVIDALLPRIDRADGEALARYAKVLRDEAAKADRLAAGLPINEE